jgi:hypothetical protein
MPGFRSISMQATRKRVSQVNGQGVVGGIWHVIAPSDKTYPETFQPGATYVATDQNQPTVARGTFTTLASGTPQAPAAPGTPGNGTTQSSQDLAGSGAVLGTVSGTLAANGALALKLGGRAVSRLATGRYTFSIVDKSPRNGFLIIGPKGTVPTDVTGARARDRDP